MNYLKNMNWKLFWMMIIGNIFLGMGVGTFKLAGMGNDPFSGMAMSLAACVGISYGNFAILLNLVLFVIEIIWGRRLIGAGTVVNAFLLAYIATFFHDTFGRIFGKPETIPMQLVAVLIGVVVCSFGISVYQEADLGVAPYDSLALIMDEKLPKISYFWCRMLTDTVCGVVCFLSGGIVGAGTVVSMFGLGPVVDFFNHIFSTPLAKKFKGETE